MTKTPQHNNTMYLRVLVCCWLCVLTQGSAEIPRKFDYKVARSIEIHDQEYVLDNSLSQSKEIRKPSPSNAQFLQHPYGGQTFYFPPSLKDVSSKPLDKNNNLNSPYTQQDNSHQKNLKLPVTSASLPTYSLPQYRMPPRKHYKIVLVRPVTTPAPLLSTVPEIEEKTLIYVLVKKPDEPTETQVQEIQRSRKDAFKLNKPEVYFINYQANKDNQSIENTVNGESHQHFGVDTLSPHKLSVNEVIR